MRAGVSRIEILISRSFSLKDRRRVMNSVKHRLRNRFNISIIETSSSNTWNQGIFGIALAGEDERGIRSVVEKIVSFLDEDDRFEVIDVSLDLI
ncbi:MAG TPA: DUF503 domain-containing protein [Atribacteraceae bacterium]|nr:DUF503 domain-containing protein [Atribacteraceae bacterium]